jgi:elongation factor P--beta-lysine ligase
MFVVQVNEVLQRIDVAQSDRPGRIDPIPVVERVSVVAENRWPFEQRARFVQDLRLRRARGQVQPPLDERLLAALAAGLPDCAGVALGVDRLTAIALAAPRLADAMAFTIDNA